MEVDRLEVEVEEECLKILALHQPVAIDLRFIISVLKINNDLERIGDLTVNVSRKTLASDVCARDDEVNSMKRAIRREVERVICHHPQQAKALLRLTAVARNLERIADLATNIAEDAIYLIEGKIVRHQDMD